MWVSLFDGSPSNLVGVRVMHPFGEEVSDLRVLVDGAGYCGPIFEAETYTITMEGAPEEYLFDFMEWCSPPITLGKNHA